MRQYVIDQLTKEERQAVLNHLSDSALAGPINDLFWLPLPADLMAPEQRSHPDCGPFYFAIEVEEERVTFELLVRSQSTLHCSCITHANARQRNFILDYVDRMAEKLSLKA